MSDEAIKKKIGETAATLVKDGMIVGLGTGSTAYWFIKSLGKRCHEGLKIKAVASSNASMILAMKVGIPMLSGDEVSHLDITIDGADEIDPNKRLIKGAGGALLREKIVASMSRELVVIADESKLVNQLGAKKLPVEIVPFAYKSTLLQIQKLGCTPFLRKTDHEGLFVTDNGNYIVDAKLPSERTIDEVDRELKNIPGVIETGFFSHLAGRLVIGFFDGQIVVRP